MKKVYFAGSIRGGRVDAELYGRMIERIGRYAKVLTEHIGGDVAALERGMSDRDIYNQDTRWLRQCDMVIAECSTPSLGVGYELAYAERLGKPVYLLRRGGAPQLSAMLSGDGCYRTYTYSDEADAMAWIDKLFGDMRIADEIQTELAAVFAGDSTGHDLYHTLRVAKLADKIAAVEGGDMYIARLAALLHDVDDYKLTGGGMGDTTRAEALMRRHGVADADAARVCAIIRDVSFKGSDTVTPPSIEGKVVQDADRLDAIGAIGIARAFAYGGSHKRAMYDPGVPPRINMSADEYAASESTTINHFYEKLLLLKEKLNTSAARVIAQRRHEFMEEFLEEFYGEWQGEFQLILPND